MALAPLGRDFKEKIGVTRNAICTQYVLKALLRQPSLQFSWRPVALTTAPLQALGNKKTQALSHESVFVPEGASAPEGGNFKPKKDGW